jgi:hypothetical protein
MMVAALTSARLFGESSQAPQTDEQRRVSDRSVLLNECRYNLDVAVASQSGHEIASCVAVVGANGISLIVCSDKFNRLRFIRHFFCRR